jgi:hypothetical protein
VSHERGQTNDLVSAGADYYQKNRGRGVVDTTHTGRIQEVEASVAEIVDSFHATKAEICCGEVDLCDLMAAEGGII